MTDEKLAAVAESVVGVPLSEMYGVACATFPGFAACETGPDGRVDLCSLLTAYVWARATNVDAMWVKETWKMRESLKRREVMVEVTTP